MTGVFIINTSFDIIIPPFAGIYKLTMQKKTCKIRHGHKGMIYSFDPVCDRKVLNAGSIRFSHAEVNRARTADYHDMIYVLSGNWHVKVRDESLHLSTGDVALLPAEVPLYASVPCSLGTQLLFIHFAKAPADRVAPAHDDGSTVKKLLAMPIFMHPGVDDIPLFFRESLRLFGSDLQFRELSCTAMLNLLLTQLSDIYNRNMIKKDRTVQDLIDCIIDNPHKFFSVGELAKKAGVSIRSLAGRFRKETGLSVHRYQMDRKLDIIAGDLKRSADVSLKTIAYSNGFFDEFHLSVAFKKRFGVSPRRYRNPLEETPARQG
jgi:AraC-like DNA-binding protein